MKIALCIYEQSDLEMEALHILLCSLKGFAVCDVYLFLWQGTKYDDLFRLKQFQNVCTDNVFIKNVTFTAYEPPAIKFAETFKDPSRAASIYRELYARKMGCLAREKIVSESGDSYDLIVTCKAGTWLNREIRLENYKKYIDGGNLLFPDNTFKGDFIPLEEEIIFGKASLTSDYCSIVDYIEEYVCPDATGLNLLPDPGFIAYSHIDQKKIPYLTGNFRTCHLNDKIIKLMNRGAV